VPAGKIVISQLLGKPEHHSIFGDILMGYEIANLNLQFGVNELVNILKPDI
jgi:hypothetical protein